jgi:hypothetical protein
MVVAVALTSFACTASGSDEAARVAESAASRASADPAVPPVFPPIGVAVMDSTGAWCAEFPAMTPALKEGAPVTIVFAAPVHVPRAGATVARRRDTMCHTEFSQPRWADYVAYDLVLADSARLATDDLPLAALVVASDAEWTRGPDGIARSDVDGDGVPEEARVCRADEGEHFTLWSVTPDGRRRLRAHEYFDWGALVDPTCGPEVTTDSA